MSLCCEGPFRVSPGFCLLVAWFAAVNGWHLTTVILGAAAVHELGHWAVLKVLGVRILGLRISALGAVLAVDRRGLSYGKELAAVLAGPAANLLSTAVLARMGLETAAGEAAARWTGTAAALALVAGLSWLMVQSGGSLWLLPAAVGALTAAGRECFGK